jgi:hypothetical protein
MQKDEYSSIIRGQMNSIMIMRYLRENGTDNNDIDPDIHCERGLESYQSKEIRKEIDMKRKIHQFLVIQEQSRQALVGTNDPELLRLLSSTQSEGSLRAAQLRATMDQHDANQARKKALLDQELEKKQQDLEDTHSRQKIMKQAPEADSDTSDPNSGIISLASLWAQEGSAFSSDEATSNSIEARWGMPNTTSSTPSSTTFFQQGLLGKPPTRNINVDAQGCFSSDSQHQSMPLVGFHGMYQSNFATKPSAHVVASQAIQNAFCSSFTRSSDCSNVSPQQLPVLQPSSDEENESTFRFSCHR